MSEHDEQAALFDWVEKIGKKKYPALKMMFAVPNGGYRHKLTAVKLKREGVKAGVPDIIFPVPSGRFHGMAIEMKFGRNKTSIEQDQWLAGLRHFGWKVVVCYSWLEAQQELQRYLKLSNC